MAKTVFATGNAYLASLEQEWMTKFRLGLVRTGVRHASRAASRERRSQKEWVEKRFNLEFQCMSSAKSIALITLDDDPGSRQTNESSVFHMD
jgi:hypothetical protein